MSGSAGRPRSVTEGGGSRKVRAPQGRVVANSHPGKPAGQCHREQTAAPHGAVRVKRWCKRPPVRQATGAARQTPPGARSDRMRSRAARPSIRVDRTRRPATVVADGWSPPRLSMSQVRDRTRPTGRPTPHTRLTCGGALLSPPQSAQSPLERRERRQQRPACGVRSTESGHRCWSVQRLGGRGWPKSRLDPSSRTSQPRPEQDDYEAGRDLRAFSRSATASGGLSRTIAKPTSRDLGRSRDTPVGRHLA